MQAGFPDSRPRDGKSGFSLSPGHEEKLAQRVRWAQEDGVDVGYIFDSQKHQQTILNFMTADGKKSKAAAKKAAKKKTKPQPAKLKSRVWHKARRP